MSTKLHLDKIEMSDEVHVLNVGGYITNQGKIMKPKPYTPESFKQGKKQSQETVEMQLNIVTLKV